MSDSDQPTASTVSSLTLALLVTLFARAGERGGDEEISIKLDAATVSMANDLVERLITATTGVRSQPIMPAHLEQQLSELGLKAVYRHGCTCFELGNASRTCACHLLQPAHL